MAEVRIEGFQEAVEEALGDIEMAGGEEAEVEPEEDAPGNETALDEAAPSARTTFIEYVSLSRQLCIR